METNTVTYSPREEILRRIRDANGGSGGRTAASNSWDAITRSYRRHRNSQREETLDLLEARLHDYDAGVFRATAAEVAGKVAELLTARGVRRIVVPAGLDPEWLPEGVVFVVDAGLTPFEVDQMDGVMTGATVAIAETGTVVLQNVPGQGRRVATLVPDYHLCVLRKEDIVETVPEAMARLQATASLSTTFISGPSATADIEMTRIKGVHGPRSLDVILVD